MNILGLDLGRKRAGLAVSGGILASGLQIIDFENEDKFVEDLKVVIEKEKTEKIIVGIPLNGQNQETEQTRWTQHLAKKIGDAIDLPIEFVNEAFTSAQAQINLLQKYNYRKQLTREEIDIESARLIVEQYLNEQDHSL